MMAQRVLLRERRVQQAGVLAIAGEEARWHPPSGAFDPREVRGLGARSRQDEAYRALPKSTTYRITVRPRSLTKVSRSIALCERVANRLRVVQLERPDLHEVWCRAHLPRLPVRGGHLPQIVAGASPRCRTQRVPSPTSTTRLDARHTRK